MIHITSSGEVPSRLQICPEGAAYLRERGLTVEYATYSGVRSVTAAEASAITCVPSEFGGLVFPYPNSDYASVRLLGDPSRRCLAPRKPIPIFIPPTTLERLRLGLITWVVVVESPLKALVLAMHGYDAVGLAGVDTTLDGDALNSSWTVLPLRGLAATILLDGDRQSKAHVALAEAKLARALATAGSTVWVASLPNTGAGDVGPDGYVAAHGIEALRPVLQSAQPADPQRRLQVATTAEALEQLVGDLPFLASVASASAMVRQSVQRAFQTKKLGSRLKEALKAFSEARTEATARGPIESKFAVIGGRHCRFANGEPVVLCNFEARIVRQIVLDSGAEQHKFVCVEGALHSGETLPVVQLPIERLHEKNWPITVWGARVVVAPGPGATDYLTTAIQLNSDPKIERVYSHTGWRQINGQWVYLHAHGAIGSTGVETSLEGILARVTLPASPSQLVVAVQWALAVERVAVPRISLPLLAAMFRAPTLEFLPFDGSVAFVGTTGGRKTSLALLVTGPWGLYNHDEVLSWTSTPASLEDALHRAKDMPIVIDDYVPDVDPRGYERRKAETILRSAGNRTTRSRMRSDMSRRENLPPRGLLISTAEDIDLTASVVARTLIVSVSPGDVDLDFLTQVQHAREQLAEAMSGYISWLSSRIEDLRDRLPRRHATWRQHFLPQVAHPRTAAVAAHLILGVELVSQFAQEVGVVDQSAGASLVERARVGLLECIGHSQLTLENQDPVVRFLDALRSMLASGDAVLDGSPSNVTLGRHIGFALQGVAYLEGDTVYTMVQQHLSKGNRRLAITQGRLWKQLDEKNLLVRREEDGRLKVRLPGRSNASKGRYLAVSLNELVGQ